MLGGRVSQRYVDDDGVIYDPIDHILGNTTESVDKRCAVRANKWAVLQTAKQLLPDGRVAKCMSCGNGGVTVRWSPSLGVASYGGVRTCGMVWHCPICSAKISTRRRAELNTLLLWGRKMGYAPALVTLTVSHGLEQSLSATLDALKKAKRTLHQSRAWRDIAGSFIGYVSATEITFGNSGWHPHFHMLFLVDCKKHRVVGLLDHLRSTWVAAVAKHGYWASDEYGFDVQDATSAGDYVTKWGAAEEMSLGRVKASRVDVGRSPWDLLVEAHLERSGGAVQSQAADLWLEYARVFQGRHQLVWSNGLKKLLGIIAKSDEELAAEDEFADAVEVAQLDLPLWKLICSRMLQAELLEVAEAGGVAASDYIDAWVQALHKQEALRNAGCNTRTRK